MRPMISEHLGALHHVCLLFLADEEQTLVLTLHLPARLDRHRDGIRLRQYFTWYL